MSFQDEILKLVYSGYTAGHELALKGKPLMSFQEFRGEWEKRGRGK